MEALRGRLSQPGLKAGPYNTAGCRSVRLRPGRLGKGWLQPDHEARFTAVLKLDYSGQFPETERTLFTLNSDNGLMPIAFGSVAAIAALTGSPPCAAIFGEG
jgi:hypothetical protein